MSEKTIKITLDDKIVILSVDDSDGKFNTEDLLSIDHSNIVGELLTFPVVFNRIGILKAQAENALREKKFEVDIYKAETAERLRKSMQVVEHTDAGKKTKSPVKDAVENAVTMDEGYQAKMKELFRAERNLAYIDSLYWSGKSKDDKLKALSHYIPKDFENEILEKAVNSIGIKTVNKPFISRKATTR